MLTIGVKCLCLEYKNLITKEIEVIKFFIDLFRKWDLWNLWEVMQYGIRMCYVSIFWKNQNLDALVLGFFIRAH